MNLTEYLICQLVEHRDSLAKRGLTQMAVMLSLESYDEIIAALCERLKHRKLEGKLDEIRRQADDERENSAIRKIVGIE